MSGNMHRTIPPFSWACNVLSHHNSTRFQPAKCLLEFEGILLAAMLFPTDLSYDQILRLSSLRNIHPFSHKQLYTLIGGATPFQRPENIFFGPPSVDLKVTLLARQRLLHPVMVCVYVL